MRVAEGLNASFVCKASGYPQPTLHWEKKGKKITNRKPLRYKVLNIQHGSVLRIEPVKKRKDSHTFTCVATNEHGEARAKAELSSFQRKGISFCLLGIFRINMVSYIPCLTGLKDIKKFHVQLS